MTTKVGKAYLDLALWKEPEPVKLEILVLLALDLFLKEREK